MKIPLKKSEFRKISEREKKRGIFQRNVPENPHAFSIVLNLNLDKITHILDSDLNDSFRLVHIFDSVANTRAVSIQIVASYDVVSSSVGFQ